MPFLFGVGSDPVRLGLVQSLAHPGGNATGAVFEPVDLTPKHLQLLRKLAPKAVRVAVVMTSGGQKYFDTKMSRDLEAFGFIGIPLRADTVAELDAAIEAIRREKAEALMFVEGFFYFCKRRQVAALAKKSRLPVVFASREMVEAGGLLSYGASVRRHSEIAVDYTSRILKGAKPAALPVQEPKDYELVVNMKAARQWGIDIPREVLLQANEVLQ